MNRFDIRNTLADAGVNHTTVLLLDSDYMLPTQGWVHGEFASALQTVLAALGLEDWVEEAWDCDKFSRFAFAYAGVLWGKTIGRPKTGLAFGTVCYVDKRMMGGHCINVFLWRDDDGIARVQFVEPQQQLGGRLVEKKMDADEIKSIWSIVM